ncbi:MAG: hypothetical protein OQK04_15055 [Kangiellaceae bacterium]|nr:hypothetical protein [Kangiellaceae bacterium]MCW9000027.1 hypothetical protein [Kangiellaceae bacterium]
MNKIYAKSLGIICLAFSSAMSMQLLEGTAAGGIVRIVNQFGGNQLVSQVLTAVLILVGVGFGVRALFWNKVCIGEQCSIDSEPVTGQ